MQTTTQRTTRPRQSSIALLNSTASRLIEQIQAEAREKLLSDLSAKDAIVVLHGLDAATKRAHADGSNITISDSKGNEVNLWRHHTEPEGWRGHDHMAGYWHPARWYGNQVLVDASGNQWRRELGIYIQDDFGNLVQVAA